MEEDEGDYGGGGREGEEEEDDFDGESWRNSKRLKSIDCFALDEDEDDVGGPPTATLGSTSAVQFKVPSVPDGPHFVPHQQNHDDDQCDAVRPEYLLIDNVSYYNLGALWTLLYARRTQGLKIPAVIDAQKASQKVNFDF